MHALIAYGEELKLPPMHHLVRVVIPEGMEIAKDVRLNEQDEIDCISCHGDEEIDETPLDQVDREATDFFVGGPYPANRIVQIFCSRCHSSKESKRTNIHIQFDRAGELIENRCTYCHLEVPDTELESMERQINESAKLRLPAQKLCLGCHLKTPHLNAEIHLKEMPIEQVNGMSGKMTEHLKQQSEKRGYRLPLSDGHITCITCHSSHQRGVVKQQVGEPEQVEDRSLEDGIGYSDDTWDKVVESDKRERIGELKVSVQERSAYREMLRYRRLTHEVLLRAPAKDGTLCLLCHKFEK